MSGVGGGIEGSTGETGSTRQHQMLRASERHSGRKKKSCVRACPFFTQWRRPLLNFVSTLVWRLRPRRYQTNSTTVHVALGGLARIVSSSLAPPISGIAPCLLRFRRKIELCLRAGNPKTTPPGQSATKTTTTSEHW